MSVSEVYQKELRKVLRKRLRGAMQPTENVLYFKNNIDVRICPKNGMSTLKWALMYIDDIDMNGNDPLSFIYGTKRHRMMEIKKYGYTPELPFRKDSTRVCVARDPVKRFMSACEYIKTEYMRVNEVIDLEKSEPLTEDEVKRLENMSDVDILPESLDDIIDGVWSGDIHNTHFYTQTYYYGNRSQYDTIWKMSEFGAFLNWLRVCTKSDRKIDRIRSNSTSGLHFGGVDSLTEDQKKRIMRIYEEDYDYGWTED